LKAPNKVELSKVAAAAHRSSRLVRPASLAQWTASTAPAAACAAG
jgi:hypothetical protein